MTAAGRLAPIQGRWPCALINRFFSCSSHGIGDTLTSALLGRANGLSNLPSADVTVPNEPNAAILMQSLRHVGYANRSAIEDIADNGIDAHAKRIVFELNHGTDRRFPNIVIADDGDGMSWLILDEALKLGSSAEHDLRSDLGKFGLGLVTAGHSLAQQIRVLTKEAEQPVYISVSDIDEMIRAGKFVKLLREANSEEVEWFSAEMEKFGFPNRRLTSCTVRSSL